ncbi:class I SAM-dependent methyltransferase [Pararhizobium sp.]|uniref:class I SAM-dependent methyltransferase n=1 Tax=Pararhizobium sp. TaxID=1977563 RepID=UPI003BA873C2
MTIHHKDYWSPNLQPDFKDTAFPNLAHGDAESAPWGRIELGVGAGAYSHPFYCHSNLIPCGYANRDEVAYMQALAKEFSHGAGLEVGCYYAWTTAHFAGFFERYDVVDPILSSQERTEIEGSLRAAGVIESCKLHGGESPQIPVRLYRENDWKPLWSFALLDGDHGYPYPEIDAVAVERAMLPTSCIVLHDVYFPPVSAALDRLKASGWKTRIVQTTAGVGVAWRGEKTPPVHIPDGNIPWVIPGHLASHTD